MGHRGSAIRQQSVTEGVRPWSKSQRGEGVVGCQPSKWMVAVTEQRDETGGEGGGVDPITVEIIGNHVYV